jgi:hypothetical protein
MYFTLNTIWVIFRCKNIVTVVKKSNTIFFKETISHLMLWLQVVDKETVLSGKH